MNTQVTAEKSSVLPKGHKRPGMRLRLSRRCAQVGTILLLIAIPVTGLFRIDPVAGAFIVLDRQVWFSDIFVVLGLWLLISSALIITYSVIGNAFCGWACPQNTLAEWANNLNRKLLGKRAEVDLDGRTMRVSKGKAKALNWVFMVTAFLVVSMLTALVPMFYFYPPGAVWSFVTLQADLRLASHMYWIYAVFTAIILLDVAFIRHFWCRFMCVYGVWQHSFKTHETLHIAHDKSSPEECSRCNFCVSSCFIQVDPRKTETYDHCINCGECISACHDVRMTRNGKPGLLSFTRSPRLSGEDQAGLHNIGSISSRVKWSIPVILLGCLMFVYGLVSYESYHLVAYKADASQLSGRYQITLANKLYQPATVYVEVDGLPEGSYNLPEEKINFLTVGREDLFLNMSQSLSPGLYDFLVRARSTDGWNDSFRLRHFVSREEK